MARGSRNRTTARPTGALRERRSSSARTDASRVYGRRSNPKATPARSSRRSTSSRRRTRRDAARRTPASAGSVTQGADPATRADHAWRPARFMVIAAHPDDAEFGPAGTAARWIDAGSEGWLVCCTSGDQGGEDPDRDPLELAALREAEQRTAAAIVGYDGVTYLHMPDGALVNDLILREHLVREIRTF